MVVTPAPESDVDLDREIRSHLELEAEEQRDAGLAPEDARRAALRLFGNPTLVKESARELRRRVSRSVPPG
jgi:hypothetical protein